MFLIPARRDSEQFLFCWNFQKQRLKRGAAGGELLDPAAFLLFGAFAQTREQVDLRVEQSSECQIQLFDNQLEPPAALVDRFDELPHLVICGIAGRLAARLRSALAMESRSAGPNVLMDFV